MNSTSLERVQQDLNVIKSALPADFPYDRASVVHSAVAALCGVLLALRAVPGWDGAMTVVLLMVIAGMVVASAGWLRRARAERGVRPRRWSWAREDAASGGIAVCALIGYALFTRRLVEADTGWTFAAWRGQLAGPALFAFGVGMSVLGVARSERRHFLGWGLALTVLGLAMPWISSRPAFWIAAGVAMASGGLASTLMLWWQLRRWEVGHVRD